MFGKARGVGPIVVAPAAAGGIRIGHVQMSLPPDRKAPARAWTKASWMATGMCSITSRQMIRSRSGVLLQEFNGVIGQRHVQIFGRHDLAGPNRFPRR